MARKESADRSPPPGGAREIGGIVLFFACVLLALSLFSYNWRDIAWLETPPNRPPQNFIGPAGAWLAYALFFLFGLPAYALPLLALAFGVLLLIRREMFVRFRFFWSLMGWLAMTVLIELREDWWRAATDRLNLHAPGGAPVRYLTHDLLVPFLGAMGTLVLALATVSVAVVMVLGRRRIGATAGWCAGLVAGAWRNFADGLAARAAARRAARAALEPYEKAPRPAAPEPRPARARAVPKPAAEPAAGAPEGAFPVDRKADAQTAPPEPPAPDAAPAGPAAEPAARARRAEPRLRPPPAAPHAAVPPPVPAAYPNYQLPPVSILANADADAPRTIESDETVTGKVIVETLADFGIETQVTNVERGPVVTCYELLPAPGVKVERIAGLSNNLALSLKAKSVRVQAPIPGKGVVGVEVPNTTASVVGLREMLEGDAWRGQGAQLPLVLGKDVGGTDLIVDLATMPHLLIAGTTGSGKTVCMNSVLAGLLMSRTPAQLNLVLVDPKIVEFTAYKGLPHLVGARKEVIIDTKKVAGALRWAIAEMDRRYKLFAKAGVRNIQGFNSRPVARQPELFGSGDAPAPKPDDYLPYIVVVVDELADLMMTAANEVEGYIMRLAQLSRATGIHMILATQRPSVNVITGTIKANFPARIAFQVAQKVDSRTILDAMGADKLLGRGDMLFLPPGGSKLIRAQGCMTSDEDIRLITDFIKAQCPPPDGSDADRPPARPARGAGPSPVSAPPEDGGEPGDETGAGPVPLPAPAAGAFEDMLESTGGGGGGDDDLVEQAIQIIRETRRASTSALQRRMKIGYTRAARVMDILEERKIVGPPRGAEAREILMDMDGDQIGDGGEPEDDNP